MTLIPYTDDQSRLAVNLRQHYEVWRETEREWRSLPYDLRRKEVGGRAYLYQISDRSGTGKSLGRMDAAAEARLAEYRASKKQLKDARSATSERLRQTGLMGRVARLPMLASAAGPILREADLRGLLDGSLLVVGTNCLIAYSLEIAAHLSLSDETDDFDLAWAADEQPKGAPFWETLKAVDPTFTLNTEREFQARNRDSYEVELLVAPSRAAALGVKEKPRPIPLPEQEWLLLGKPVDQIVLCRDASAARIVAPDPRWFALHKLWLGNQSKRNALKKEKDQRQGSAILEAVEQAMPHYPLDEAFVATIPDELLPYWKAWWADRPTT
jgi:hypothetical protein